MKRIQLSDLLAWKNRENRKPLIIQGARQVGKTWLMKEFGKQEFKQTIYINFEKSDRLRNLFQSDFDLNRIILSIEIETGQKFESENTLLIFDEIQEASRGLTALKYFYEEAPHYYVMAAGSLLGVSLQNSNSFPVGKVDFLQMHPMSFTEFLENIGEDKISHQLGNQNFELLDLFHEKLIGWLRLYYFIGGMPECISTFLKTNDLNEVREIQQKILLGYQNDFSKHAPNEIVPKINMVWNGILSQLAKENRKFIYGQIKSGSRAKEFEAAINWLNGAGLITQVNRVNKPNIPLKSYIDFDAFKLFILDIGLLNAMANIDQKILLEKNKILTEYKGAMTEQFVCQQLLLKNELFYWSATNARSEINFLIQNGSHFIPIEVKAEENLKAKSLKVFNEKFNPTKSVRFSMSKFRKEDRLINIPLYAADNAILKD